MPRRENLGRPKVLSFSGIDGAGKSTQIRELQGRLAKRNLRVDAIPFWDEVACLTRMREGAGHALFKGDRGVGVPSAPIRRRDKNVQSGPMTLLRYLLYFLDALSASRQIMKARRANLDAVIFDRFIYDELANLDMRYRINRIYSRFLMTFVARPDVSFILDANPVEATARKPEYPIEFVEKNRASYLALNALIGGMTVISPMAIECAAEAIDRAILPVFSQQEFAPEASLQPSEP